MGGNRAWPAVPPGAALSMGSRHSSERTSPLLSQGVRCMFHRLIQPLIQHSFLRSPAPTEPHLFGQLTSSVHRTYTWTSLSFIQHMFMDSPAPSSTVLSQGLSTDFFKSLHEFCSPFQRGLFLLPDHIIREKGNLSSWWLSCSLNGCVIVHTA